jgi:hypothetical protein
MDDERISRSIGSTGDCIMTMSGRRQHDFPPGLQGGLEHDDEDHRLGETSQTGPEAPGDVNRSHPERGSTDRKEGSKDDPGAGKKD